MGNDKDDANADADTGIGIGSGKRCIIYYDHATCYCHHELKAPEASHKLDACVPISTHNLGTGKKHGT